MPAEAAISKPNPDPSTLTTEQMEKAVHCSREILEARILGIEKTVEHQQKFLNERQAAIEAGVSHLEKLHDVKFMSVDTRFTERDTRTEKTAELNQKAIDAALAAQEKASGRQNEAFVIATAKSEAAFTKEIDGIKTLNDKANTALEDKIEQLRQAVSLLDRRLESIGGHGKGISDFVGWIFGAAGFVSAVVAIVIMITNR